MAAGGIRMLRWVMLTLLFGVCYSTSAIAANLQPPTDILLSNQTINENAGANAVIGNLTAVDADQQSVHTFQLASGTGDYDNAFFSISGSTLRTVASFNYENKASYTVRVQASDGLFVYAKAFQIIVHPVNEAPNDLLLSKTFLAENGGANAFVATMSAVDPDSSQTFAYALVNGAGGQDNAMFQIQSNVLRAKHSLNFESKSNYFVRIQVSDGQLTFEKAFELTVTDVNETPNDIILSGNVVPENSVTGTVVGNLTANDPDAGSSFSYYFVDGIGDSDNFSFEIVGNQLRTLDTLNFEDKSLLSVRVQVSDGSLTYEEVFAITVIDVAEAPSDISLQPGAIAEHETANQVVGQLTAIDQDAGSSFSFELVSGMGDADNESFAIDGNTLRALVSFNYEQQSTYSVRVQVSDGALTYAEGLLVSVLDVNEAPTDMTISDDEVAENRAVGTEVAVLSASSPDLVDEFAFQLVPGDGADDNDNFMIDGDKLLTNQSFDFEGKDQYTVRIKVLDGIYSHEKTFTIRVSDVNEAPLSLGLDTLTFDENAAIGTQVGTLTATDADVGDVFSYRLVSGVGANDNTLFQLDGNRLLTTASLDYEKSSRYSVRLEVTDARGLSLQNVFLLTIGDVNEAPTQLRLSSQTIVENGGANAQVGRLQAKDEDAGAILQYQLVEGIGAQDNGTFVIDGDVLMARQSFDYENKSQFSVRIRVSDGSLTLEEVFVITVLDDNEAPTGLVLKDTDIAENSPAQTVVGAFSVQDEDAANVFTFRLVSGEGDADNGAFTIEGTQLRANAAFNFEVRKIYKLRVRVSDGEFTFEQPITVEVTDVNESPSKPTINNISIAENLPFNAPVALLAATDVDAGTTLNYAFDSGVGDADNRSFAIVGSRLLAPQPFDFEQKKSYSIRVRVSDGALSNVAVFVLSIRDVNEAPTDLKLLSDQIVEFSPANTAVGMLDAVDADVSSKFSYALVSGAGSSDNGSFVISGNMLRSRDSFDFYKKSSYSVRLRVTDGGNLSHEKVYAVRVVQRQYAFDGYMPLFADGNFYPDRALTRAEVASMVMRLIDQSERKLAETDLRIDYLDVGAKSRHAALIARVTRFNVMAGYPDGSFRPDRLITHREMRTVIMNYLTLMSIQNVGKAGNMFCQHCRSNFHLSEVRAYLDGRKLTGAPAVLGGNRVTRAEAAVLLNRLFHRGPIRNVSKSSWKDIPSWHWAMREIEAATVSRKSTRNADDSEQLVVITKK